MAQGVTITGTRSTAQVESQLPGLFAEYVGPFSAPGAAFYVGGAVGIDTAALDWLARHSEVSLTVVVPCTLSDQPAVAVEAVQRCRRQGRLADVVELGAQTLSTAAYHARNRWMVDRSDMVVGFPRGAAQTSGTWYTLNYAASQNKPRLIVPLRTESRG